MFTPTLGTDDEGNLNYENHMGKKISKIQLNALLINFLKEQDAAPAILYYPQNSIYYIYKTNMYIYPLSG